MYIRVISRNSLGKSDILILCWKVCLVGMFVTYHTKCACTCELRFCYIDECTYHANSLVSFFLTGTLPTCYYQSRPQ